MKKKAFFKVNAQQKNKVNCKNRRYRYINPDGNFGYNTFINPIYKLPYQVPYSFAYNLEEYIDKESILSKHTHSVPIYEEKSYQYREKIIALSGQNNTLFIGAY